MQSDDEAIAEFHAAARRKRRVVMIVAAVACLSIGAAILVATFAADAGSEQGGGRFESRTIVAGLAFLGAGLACIGAAVKGS